MVGLSDSVCHWSKVNIGVTCGEFRTNIKLFSYISLKTISLPVQTLEKFNLLISHIDQNFWWKSRCIELLRRWCFQEFSLPHSSDNSIIAWILHDCTGCCCLVMMHPSVTRRPTMASLAHNDQVCGPMRHPPCHQWPGHVARRRRITRGHSLSRVTSDITRCSLASCGVTEAGPGNFPIF